VASQEELQDLAVGTLLHDIGKSEIPKEILNKTGPLTHDEMEVMKSHVERGEKILSEKDGMTAARMLPVLLHHERINGTGYPRRLNAEQIHVHGKIAAIADCFDAMTTNRPYMRAKTAFEAIELMKGKLQGSFDEALLESFIMLLGKAR
jgi:HD-GYP domain-containing protein (c-di-GMP phosphodiesterase class II)